MGYNKTLAYINLHAVLASIEALCKYDEEAKQLATTPKPISIGFNVTDGPMGKLVFNNGECKFVGDDLAATIKLKLFSCEHLNAMVDGKKNPVPYWGFHKLSFLLNNFTQISDLLGKYLKATEAQLEDREFFVKSTSIMFHVIVGAIAQIGNVDKTGRVSAAKVVDGEIAFEIIDGPAVHIVANKGFLTFVPSKAKNPRSKMVFENIDVARGLFDGRLDAMTCIATGAVSMSGMISQIDNINRILSQVGNFLSA